MTTMFLILLVLCWLPLALLTNVSPTHHHYDDDSASIVGRGRGYNIALHAQVIPTEHKVVGSVITTNGLKAALLDRFDISHVEIFYPGQYKGYLEQDWDFVVIEGWFLGLNEFIQVTRNRFPSIIIVFYCLDPTYPSLTEILSFDVDGIMTNSMMVQQRCQELAIPSIYLMLAADTNVMKPNITIERSWKSVYVGAGGLMLQQKPALQQMLVDAKRYGLRLHGTGWDTVPQLRDVWSGPLPQNELSSAYASAEIVLASTIQSQDEAGMINNRIFEALACGSIVMTCDSPTTSTLAKMFGNSHQQYPYDLIDFYQDSTSFDRLLQRIQKDPHYIQKRRQFAREFILHRHTWAHRCIEMMNFLTYLKSIRSDMQVSLPRPNQRKLLWIESEELQTHLDYAMMLKPNMIQTWSKTFSITYVTEKEWLTFYEVYCLPHLQEKEFTTTATSKHCLEYLSQFEAVFSVITVFDAIDQTMMLLSSPSSPFSVLRNNRGVLQRRFAYLMGISLTYYQSYCADGSNNKKERPTACQTYNHYDTVFYRTGYEFDLLQDQFGVHIDDDRVDSSSLSVDNHGNNCPIDNRNSGSNKDAKTYRSQALFAIPSIVRNITIPSVPHPSTLQSDSQSPSPPLSPVIISKIRRDVAFICFYHHRQACHRSQRVPFMKNYNQVPVLILLGGSLEQWLDEGSNSKDVNDPVITEEDSLSSVIHVSDSLLRFDDLILFLESIESLIIMTGGSLMDAQTLSSHHRSTTNDVLFPFVAGAILNRRIHLSHMNSHLIQIAQEGYCMSWDNVAPYYHWDRHMYFALDRIFGMPSRKSAIELQPLQLSPSTSSGGISSQSQNKLILLNSKGKSTKGQVDNGGDNKCLNCDHVNDEMLIASGYIDHLISNTNHYNNIPFALIRIDYKNFENGPDGQLCVNSLYGKVDDMMCFLRPMQYVMVKPKNPAIPLPRNTNTGEIEFHLLFSIRGNLFADLIWNLTVTISPSMYSPNSFKNTQKVSLFGEKNRNNKLEENGKSADFFKQFTGLIMDSIFMYDYP